MRAMLEWLMAARWRATVTVVLLALLPMADLLGAALLALVLLRHGLRECLLVSGIAVVAVFAAEALLGLPPEGVVLLVAVTWIPVILLALILRISSSQARVLQGVAMLSCGIVVGMFAALGDPAEMWLEAAEEHLLPWLDESGVDYDRASLEAALPDMAGLMTGLAVGFWMLGRWLSLMVGRWWQAMLYNPGGFRKEFHGLRLGIGMTGLGGVLFIAGSLTGHPLLSNLALVLVLVFAVQGLAVVHGVVGLAKLHWAWLVTVYVLAVVLPPHMLALLAVSGFIDQWVDFRGRIARRSGGG